MNHPIYIPKLLTCLYSSFLSCFAGVDWLEEACLVITATLLAAVMSALPSSPPVSHPRTHHAHRIVPLWCVPEEITRRVEDFVAAPFEHLWRVPQREDRPRAIYQCGPRVEEPEEPDEGDWGDGDEEDSAYDSGYADEWVSDPGF
ncbi:uncharacterized protein BDZ99DRAFT_288791 [Mytilinidion resinicola]|uniref:Uncharacterized protein n=1 Tax=Mytilinidion resinicola TaxID=574789 RepID=A0A6A6YQG9_9PEZI|nr:uncharacterized protein BDZ99DRAFT_288791 [Mytilinidion resinicola]KAF2810778.1 hypothetical protein BDZ99DRAFT_288791 [Mytilinidion resinicola]